MRLATVKINGGEKAGIVTAEGIVPNLFSKCGERNCLEGRDV